MKRLCYLVVLMALSSSADAGSSLSFVVGGHRIRIEAPRHCNSPSCVSISIPGVYQNRHWRDRDDDDDLDVAHRAEAKPPATQQAAVPQVVASPAIARPAIPPAPPAVIAPPPAVFRPAAAATQQVAAPPQPAVQLPKLPPPAAEKPAGAARPPAIATPQVLRVSHRVEDEPADTPIGDWRSEGNKGTVRIERCGRALCGYMLDSASNNTGEAVLINMKPKTDSQWTGSVYSNDSSDTYYGTMALRGSNSLRVEACAFGRFYCSGNVWTRIGGKTGPLISSRQMASEPRS